MIFFLLACTPDDVKDDTSTDTADTDADTDTDTDTDTDSPGDITGSWVSEDDDISAVLAAAPFSMVYIEATFNTDGSYAVAATNASGTTYDLIGTYTVGLDTNPGTIVTEQTSPQALTASGIFQVVGTTLTYEVAQTSPDAGLTAPTPEAGFGSTGGPGVAAGSNVQTYQRM